MTCRQHFLPTLCSTYCGQRDSSMSGRESKLGKEKVVAWCSPPQSPPEQWFCLRLGDHEDLACIESQTSRQSWRSPSSLPTTVTRQATAHPPERSSCGADMRCPGRKASRSLWRARGGVWAKSGGMGG